MNDLQGSHREGGDPFGHRGPFSHLPLQGEHPDTTMRRFPLPGTVRSSVFTSTVKPCSIGPAAATRAREARLHGVGEARQFTGADLLPLRGAGQSGRETPAAAVAKPGRERRVNKTTFEVFDGSSGQRFVSGIEFHF
jgi:hypothetical protein